MHVRVTHPSGMMVETQESFNTLFILTKIFAAFPVTFQSKSGNKEFCFRWKSFRTVYAVTVIITMSLDTITFVYLGIKQGISSIQIGKF